MENGESGVTGALWRPAAAAGDVEALTALGISPLLAGLLLRRGVGSATEARTFLEPAVEDLHDPFLLPGAEEAVDRLMAAARDREKVAIVGDYDVDGVTATALLVAVLKTTGLDVVPILPERLEEGYGFQTVHVEIARKNDCRLIVTADCGSTSAEAAHSSREAGIDVIVTDHHLGGGHQLPDGMIEVNPHRADSQYPFPALSGAGVVFKLMTGLLGRVGRQVNQDALLRIACLGTICDLVPMVGENRIIAAKGLEALPATRSVGLWSLMNRAGVEPPITAVDVGFRVGPRLNAAGRLASPKLALDLLLTTERDEARRLAEELDNLNRQRQRAEAAVVEDALERLESQDSLPSILVAWSKHWHPGVLGIAAGRIARTFHRPTVLLTVENGSARGSGRSVPGVHLFDFLSRWRQDYERFGGHEQAIGITVPSADLDDIQRRWSEAADHEWDAESLTKVFEYELDLRPEEVTAELLSELEQLQPFGMGNRRPLLKVGPLRLASSPRMFGRGHLSARAVGPDASVLALLGWGWQDRAGDLGGEFDIVGTLELDRYAGGPVLRLLDARPSQTSAG